MNPVQRGAQHLMNMKAMRSETKGLVGRSPFVCDHGVDVADQLRSEQFHRVHFAIFDEPPVTGLDHGCPSPIRPRCTESSGRSDLGHTADFRVNPVTNEIKQ